MESASTKNSLEELYKILPVGDKAARLTFTLTSDGSRLGVQYSEDTSDLKYFTTEDGSQIASGLLESGASFSIGPRTALHIHNPSIGIIVSAFHR
jgi:hypothetical protein